MFYVLKKKPSYDEQGYYTVEEKGDKDFYQSKKIHLKNNMDI